MRKTLLCIFVMLHVPAVANATVIEFNSNDGSVTIHAASDYLAEQRRKRMKPPVTLHPRNAEPTDTFDPFIQAASRRHKVDLKLIRAIMFSESANLPEAVSPKGAQGLMQLMPATAERFGVSDSFDPEQNIEGGTRYLRFLLDRYDGDITLAVAAYNAGEGAVDRYKGIPPYKETVAYVRKVEQILNNSRIIE